MPSTLYAARPALATFAAMGILWGSFAATFPDIKIMLGVDEAGLGLLVLGAPIAAVLAMLVAPVTGRLMGRLALPLASIAMALAFLLPGQAPLAGGAMLAAFALGMAACGATTGTLDVLMNARVASIENARGQSLMNLCHAGYSLGYAGSALLSGALRASNWPPGQVMGAAAIIALVLGLFSYEAEGRIDGLEKPKDGSSPALGRVAVVGGAIVLIAFLSENAA
ncbi:MAG: MFS transporter, partial [Pseudorhodobacter sp.]